MTIAHSVARAADSKMDPTQNLFRGIDLEDTKDHNRVEGKIDNTVDQKSHTDTGVDLEVRTDIDFGVHTDIEVDLGVHIDTEVDLGVHIESGVDLEERTIP